MGNGRLDIGVGLGGATVWNPNQAIQNFGNLIQQQKKQDASDANAIAAELSKVKSDGLRNDADRQYFLNRYNEIKNNAIAGARERNSVKKALIQAQTKDALMGLQQYVARSKQQGAQEAAFGRQLLSNRSAWDDTATSAYQKSIQSAMDSDGVVKDFTTLERRPNVDKINKDLSGFVSNNLRGQVWQDKQRQGAEGNKSGTYISQSRSIDPQHAYLTAGMYYDTHPDFEHFLKKSNPEIFANNDAATAKSLAIKSYMDNGLQSGAFGPTVENKPERFSPNRVDDWKEKALWRLAHKSEGNYVPGIPNDNAPIPYNGGIKGANVLPKGYVAVTGSTINLAGSPSYNLTTGSKEPQALSSGDYQLVGAGNIPFIKDGPALADKKYIGTIAQQNFAKQHPELIEYRPMLHVQSKGLNAEDPGENHLVDFNRLPANLSKATKVALSGFKASMPSSQAQTGTASFDVNGTRYDIPVEKQQSFLKAFPNAKSISTGKRHADHYGL